MLILPTLATSNPGPMPTKKPPRQGGTDLSVGRGEKLSVKKGGLTAKGRKKYNAATGSNLKAPVTGRSSRLWMPSVASRSAPQS